jgi:hypothetical protein
MAAMAGGYSAGGRMADSPRAEPLLYVALLASATWQLLARWTAPALLPRLAEMGEGAGVALGAFVLFAPPMASLAATGPVLVRLCAEGASIGRAAGLVSALSTAGSLAGVVGTIFWLLPSIGTGATLQAICGACALLGVAGLVLSRARQPVAVPIAAVFVPLLVMAPGLGWSEGAAWSAESRYNLVRVVQAGGQWQLQLNHPSSVHTIRENGTPWTGYYYDAFALGPLLVPARRALVLGMGAGASVHALRVTAPDIDVDAVEVDPRVVEAATRWFGVDLNDPRLHVHVEDARRFLSRDAGPWDLVQLDVYAGGPYVPFHLVTEEFFRLARSRMADDALLMMNVHDPGAGRAVLLRLAATMRRVFPSVKVARTDAANDMLFAFTRVPRARPAPRPLAFRSHPALRDLEMTELVPPAGTPVFTDDHAPVEALTRAALAGR